MKRSIHWGLFFHELELAYEKAEEDADIARLLEKLEAQALTEARTHGGMILQGLTASMFDGLDDEDKESFVAALGRRIGLGGFETDISNARIVVRLTAQSPAVQACTFLDIIDRIENLDGSLNVLIPKWQLQIQAPLGGKKGLMQWEMLLMQLYPWLSIQEVSTTETATLEPVSMPQETAKQKEQKKPQAEKKTEQQKAQDEKVAAFFAEMLPKESFRRCFSLAKTELGSAISKGIFTPKIDGKLLTLADWTALAEQKKQNFVMLIGKYGITKSALICVDFMELVPNCLALALLHMVWSGEGNLQAIDAGDDGDVHDLVQALELVNSCVEGWSCTILSPKMVQIGTAPKSSLSEKKTEETKKAEMAEPERKVPEKNGFWQKLLGKLKADR